MTAKTPCPRCQKEIHPVRELARNCPRCMGRFHGRCARDGDECTACKRVFAPPVLGAFIFDKRESRASADRFSGSLGFGLSP